MNLNIAHAVIHIPPTVSAEAMASMERLMQSLGRTAAPEVGPTTNTKPQIGAYWPSEGGFYGGDMRGDDGIIYGLIKADCGPTQDVGRAQWGPNGELELSQWDGLVNTHSLGGSHPAARLAAGHTADGHTDFYLPSRRELQLLCATVPHLFGAESWYHTSTPSSENYAWAVDFAIGYTDSCLRYREFRVCPVRRVIY